LYGPKISSLESFVTHHREDGTSFPDIFGEGFLGKDFHFSNHQHLIGDLETLLKLVKVECSKSIALPKSIMKGHVEEKTIWPKTIMIDVFNFTSRAT